MAALNDQTEDVRYEVAAALRRLMSEPGTYSWSKEMLDRLEQITEEKDERGLPVERGPHVRAAARGALEAYRLSQLSENASLR